MQKINDIRQSVIEKSPLIHCITNPISINQCANTVLAVGARPMMAEHPDEVAEITETADALLLNLGNITDARMKSMSISIKKANEKHIPVVFDVVGVACSSLRRHYALALIEKNIPQVIKGNYSEITALFNGTYRSAGVDADVSLTEEQVSITAVKLARKYKCMVLVSGKNDIITDGKQLVYVKNGTKMLSSVTGTGCMLGALCATYLTVEPGLDSLITACAMLGISGQLSETDKGNGTFMVNLMDKLSVFKSSRIEKYIDVEVREIE